MSEDYCRTCSDGCCLDHERLAEARAEIAALQVFAQDANEAFASGCRDTLTNLRAKVKQMRREAADTAVGNEALYAYDEVLLALLTYDAESV